MFCSAAGHWALAFALDAVEVLVENNRLVELLASPLDQMR
jgi:hypothetical protein